MGPSTSGVRADCPIEIVFETSEVMKHAWLMESSSEGVLTREPVPGSCILYIRDTQAGQTLYARPAGPEQQQEDTMEEETSRPHGQASASASAEEVPDTSSGPMLVELACEKCQRVTIPGQFVCLECGQRLKAGHRANIRAKAREDRSKHANRIADKLMQSFDAEAIATARKHRQRALKKQEGGRHFTSVSDRFTRDSQFALRLLENGVDRERALQLDYLCNAKLPAPPRTREQIIGGLGSLSEVGPRRGDDKMNTTARLCFLSDEPEDLVKAGLIDPRMPPICIAWLGAFMPVTKFAKVWSANRKTVQYLHLFQRHPLIPGRPR